MKVSVNSNTKPDKILNIVFAVILILYPLRHIFQGIDLWDTGYNYANFEYMGYDHMDSMWLFSTYLANAAGHLIMKLPFALSLAGMNFYTGLFVSLLALAGYIFCTKKLGIPKIIVFIGEIAAVSLCWCPTALLYNYLTYVLFAACVILLYFGLTAACHQNLCLFAAGLCLGTNVLVRFSNLPEAALIVAVWAYGVIEWQESGRTSKTFHITIRRTLICFAGYMAALAVLFSYIHIRYGIGEYIEGVGRLFAMTDTATDYKADSMIMGMVNDYRENLYWVIRIAFFVMLGMIVFAVLDIVERALVKMKAFDTWGQKAHILRKISIAVNIILGIVMALWLYIRGFCSLDNYTYGPMRRPTILFMLLAMAVAVVRILAPRAKRQEKLISGLVVLIILLTSIGSNNKTYPSMNNLFIAAPYAMWELWKFVKNVGDKRIGKIFISSFPTKCVLSVFTIIFVVQSLIFGSGFVFAEATGAQNMTAKVENNDILKGVRMSPERAEWLSGLTEYTKEKNLEGNDVILYGEIPALSFYLQMPAAFNPWSELPSYALSVFEKDLNATEVKMQEDDTYRPVIILEKKYAECMDELAMSGVELKEADLETIAELIWETDVDSLSVRQRSAAEKFVILLKFVSKNNYTEDYRNEKFILYR
jgi:hypothetical protein